MTVAVLAEKPSAARNMAKALGGTSGSYQGEDFIIVAARGHLFELKQPHEQVPADLSAKYKSWELDNLPWDSKDFSWELEPREGARDTLSTLKKALLDAKVSEIAIATDVDPTGEGGAIAGNIIVELGADSKKLSRMYFTDEAAGSIQKAFTSRKALAGGIADFDEYKKAVYRSRLDMLTMQETRVATKVSGQRAVYRNGRLKSPIVRLVGDQKKAHDDYQKIPFYENRFRDENGVVYKNEEEPRFASKDEVPGGYVTSPVVVDSTTEKRTSPPRLLDLAGLSARLSPKGAKAQQVLKTYQAMYEAQVVSYPRTEDKTITTEQFNELKPKIDDIASVVGADVSALTHRTPRKSHVKDSGAHGANRPGPNVPGSLSELEQKFGPLGSMIYEELARSYLAMAAEDYVYDQQKGHLEKYEDFLGVANIPKEMGFKAIFSSDDQDEDEDESTQGLGTSADPFVHEGFPPRPPAPTQKWLMKQLEKRDVGTGATRTSTYAEVTNEKSKYPLLIDRRGKISLSEHGQVNYLLLPNTHIGDLTLTERVYATMRGVADGSVDADVALAEVADWVRDDLKTMADNAETMRSTLGLEVVAFAPKEKHSGLWKGQEVSFNREWSNHRFTDQELQDLLDGKEISFDAVSKGGNEYVASGQLAEQSYQGRKFFGFKLAIKEGVPDQWAKHVFTDEEKETLESGGEVKVTDAVSKAGAPLQAILTYGVEKGESRKKIIPNFNTGDVPKAWGGHTFTPSEVAALEKGETITASDFVSKRTKKTYTAEVVFKEETPGEGKRIVPLFDKKKSGGGGGSSRRGSYKKSGGRR